MRCTSCGILLNCQCTNAACQKIHGQATGTVCDWCLQREHEAITLLNSADLQYIALDDLLKQATHGAPEQTGRSYVPPILQSA